MTDWKMLMKKMDGSGPPLGKRRKLNDAKAKESTYEPSDFFDVTRHGYYRVKGQLMYRFPDGSLHPATGVDEFGPFDEAPMPSYWDRNKFIKR